VHGGEIYTCCQSLIFYIICVCVLVCGDMRVGLSVCGDRGKSGFRYAEEDRREYPGKLRQ